MKKEAAKVFIELTERGRWLKQQGSMAQYHRYQDLKKQKKKNEKLDREREVNRNENAYYLTFCIAIATAIAAIYYTLEIIRIHRPQWLPLSFAFLLVLIGGVIGGSLQYLLQLIDRIIKKYKNK